MIFASLFSGFGLADIGALQAGCELAWGVELDPQVAEVSRQLVGHKIYNQSVLETDWKKLEKPTDLWVSPPCQKFSSANNQRGETRLDLELAKAITEAIATLQPERVYLENVHGYRRSESVKLIENKLFSLGYMVARAVLNSADFGVPQTRKRLILRAVRGEFPPPLPTPKPWLGWYDAIADILPGLPDSKFTAWQGNLIPPETQQPPCLVDCRNTFRKVTIKLTHQPAFTIMSSMAERWYFIPKVVLSDRIAALDARSLGRLQTLPDWYELPDDIKLACKGIGNGVPCKLAEAVVMSCLAAENYLVA